MCYGHHLKKRLVLSKRNPMLKTLSVSFIFFLPLSAVFSQVQWADSLIGFSSQQTRQTKQVYKANQVLGKPSKLPATGYSNAAWCPNNNNSGYEFIQVGFHKPQYIRQVAVGENANPGSIQRIIVYGSADSLEVYLNPNPGPVEGVSGRLFTTIFPRTTFEVHSVKVELDTKTVPEFNQIDCIGISDSEEPIAIHINLINSDEAFNDPENLGETINSAFGEFCPVIAPNGKTLYFTRQDHPENIPPVSNQDIWYAEIMEDGTFAKAKNLGTPLNNSNNSALCSITPDGQQALLINVYLPDGGSETGISTANFNGTGWDFPEKVIIDSFYNDNKYGEYFLSNSGLYLVITVERKDAIGGKDIYVSFKKEDGSFSIPIHTGQVLNTAESEISPFLASDDKTLYFSTKGHSGYGGSDLFMSRRLDDSWIHWSEPVNLGPSINTPEFDAYFSIPASGNYAYFSSYQRSFGSSDLFRQKLPASLKPEAVALVRGFTIDQRTQQPMRCKITYRNLSNGKMIGEGYSDSLTGKFELILPRGANYAVIAERANFYAVNESFDLRNLTDYEEVTKNLYLIPIEVGEIARLNNLFFDFNKSNLKTESFLELDYLVNLMSKRPTMKIQIQGHTDDVGDNAYNLDLSKKRALSVYNYLIEKGVSAERLNYKGFGEMVPYQQGTDEQSRQLNRRVEFLIIQI